MNPALIHFYSEQNVGDAAILAALKKLTGERSLDILGLDEKEKASTASALISVGGDIFNNGRPGLVTRRFLSKLGQLRWVPERTMLFGQSIPPSCDGISLRLLAMHLKRISSVTVRDPLSVEKLRSCGVDARLSVDNVFALSGAEADKEAGRRLFTQAGLAPEQTALFSIRSFNHMYRTDEADYLNRIAATMRKLIDEGLSVAVLLQAEVNEADSDQAQSATLLAQVPELKILDPFRSEGEPWRVALGALDAAKTVIGTRYHTAIFRMICGKMPVGIWYSNKGEDLHSRFGVPGGASDSFDPAEIAAMALAHADTEFDAEPLRRQVEQDFYSAYDAIHGILQLDQAA